jgi:hypothetical protein
MAITDIYQDLIMNPDYMPNRLQNLQNFPPVDTRTDVFNTAMYDDPNIPGYNFIDAPTSLSSRISNPQFLNNPRRGIIDNLIMQRGNPGVNLFTKTKDAITSGVGKGIDLGKSAIGGILSLVSGIPGIGVLANMLPERDYRQTALEDFYGNIQNGTIQSGLMAGYNPVSGGLLNMLTGGRYGDPTSYGLQRSYQKRIDMITKNLGINKYKNPDAMRKRLEQLEELKRKEAQALEDARNKAAAELESQRRGRRPGSGGDGPGTKDSGGPTGGYSYDSGGRQGFGYGLKKGGLVGLL